MTSTRIISSGMVIFGAALCIGYIAFTENKNETNNQLPNTPSIVKPNSQTYAGKMPASADELSSLKEQIAILGVQVTQLRQELNTLKQKNNTEKKSDSTENIAGKLSMDPAARNDAENTHRQEMAALETAFHAETHDSRWANNASSQIRDSLNTNQTLQNNLRNIECHSKTCRIEFSNGEANGLSQSLPALLVQLAPTIPSMSAGQIDQTNDSSTVLYLSAK